MIDPKTEAILQSIVRRESRSLLSYIGDAFPWTTEAGSSSLIALASVVKAEGAAVNALGNFLVRQRLTPPPLGSYPASFTSLNFVALSFLLPRLIDEERHRSPLSNPIWRPSSMPAPGQPLDALLAVKKRNLTILQGLVTPRQVPA